MSLLMACGSWKEGWSGGFDDDARLAAHREIHGIGDEAGVMRRLVRGLGLGWVAGGSDGHRGAQHHLDEAAAIAFGGHRAFGSIAIRRHHHAGHGGHVQIRQHVAGRQRRDQHVLGIVLRGIAAEGGVGRTGDRRLAVDADDVVAAVVAVAVRAAAEVAGPFHGNAIVMLMVHGFDSSCWDIHAASSASPSPSRSRSPAITPARLRAGWFWLSLNLPSMRSIETSRPTIARSEV